MNKKNINKIQFHYLYKPFFFVNRNRLKLFIINILEREGKKVETINFIFCSDDCLLEINKKYLNHRYYTDIITFELSKKEQHLISDIFISVDRLKENALTFKTSFTLELHRVIFHGVLHLVGYKDKSKSQSRQMRAKEDKYLEDYHVSRNTVSP